MRAARCLFAATAICLAVSVASSAQQAKDNGAEVALRAAIKIETIDGDLRAAIEAYKKVVATYETHRAVAARALRELKKQGYDKPVVGETVLTSQKVIELAGDAANGAVAHVGLTADAPIPGVKAFAEKFQKEYGYKPDHNGLKGYTAMYVVKAVTEKVGKVDPKAFATAMHGVTLAAKQYPGVLMDVSFDQNGDIDRESFMTKVVNGKQQVTDVLPPASAK